MCVCVWRRQNHWEYMWVVMQGDNKLTLNVNWCSSLSLDGALCFGLWGSRLLVWCGKAVLSLVGDL